MHQECRHVHEEQQLQGAADKSSVMLLSLNSPRADDSVSPGLGARVVRSFGRKTQLI